MRIRFLLLFYPVLACGRADESRRREVRAAAQPESVAVSAVPAVSAGLPSEAALNAMVRRVPPDSLVILPISVRATLTQRRCLVPQIWGNGPPANAVFGAFTNNGQAEWAVLCSLNDTSQILVVDAKTGTVADSLGRSADANWIQGIGDGKWGFSRLLGSIKKESMHDWKMDLDERWIPQPIDHDAINEAFVEKAAVAYYRARGIWYRVMTAD